MRYRIGILLLQCIITTGLCAQQQDTKRLRIVDTLTIQEKASRNPVILKSELDSLIKQHNAGIVQIPVQQPVKETDNDINQYIMAGLVAILAFLCIIVYMFYRHQRKINKTIAGLNNKAEQKEQSSLTGSSLTVVTKEKNGKTKMTPQSLENKISDLNAELHKLVKENEGLNRVIKEYNGIQHEYDSLKHGMLKAYKVKNYPGYDKTKDDKLAMQGVLETENSVANYAYEKFLKPILSITDANKNNPAKLSGEDQERLLDLLVSLSLLYIEYLYLRVNDLAIGGKMVERISHLSKGNGPDLSLLKKMNTEFGSRALVIRMALNKTALHQLSYPVFDETNLNNQ